MMAVFFSIKAPRACPIKRHLLVVVLQRELLIALFLVFDVQRMRFGTRNLAVATRWLR
jgi:hypothetical protein